MRERERMRRKKSIVGGRQGGGGELWVLSGEDGIKKGPWTAEEDEVLINHVSKCGPRDWSSIRSKGLLHRTGKSCRLRWVNKLRPNLKTGMKFSGEEERVVIELQAQLGNKWAQIASHLPGRTDNDVKNFWSSRQKKLARLLKTPLASSKSKSDIANEIPLVHAVPIDMEAPPKLSSSTEEEVSPNSRSFSSSSLSSLSKCGMMFKMVPACDLLDPNLLSSEPTHLQLEFNNSNEEENTTSCEPQPQVPFPKIADEAPLSFDNGNPNYLDLFGNGDGDVSDLGNISHDMPLLMPPFCDDSSFCSEARKGDDGGNNAPDSYFDDFPSDLFGHMASLPSPSKW